MGLASLLESEKDWKPAVVEYREVSRLKPEWAEPHMHSGTILTMYLKDHEGALHEFQQAARLDPKNDDAFWYLGEELMYYRHNPGGAIAPFRSACQLKPDNYLYHRSLGDALVETGDKAAGWEEYRKAHELKPDDQDIRTKFEALSKELGK
jgi:Flp pilus assembly protein TadD